MRKKRVTKKKPINNTKPLLYIGTGLFTIVFFIGLYFFSNITLKNDLKIKRGGIANVIKGLQEQNISVGILDKYAIAFFGKPRAGVFHFDNNNSLSRIAFLKKIATQKPDTQDMKITLIPGETLDIFFDEIAHEYDYNTTKLFASYYRYSPYKEAGIIPDTYYIDKGMDEDKLMNFVVEQSEKKYQESSTKYFGKYDTKAWQKILVKASIIQKEAANNQEMPIVSSVIDNRIAKGMKLQMDGSLNYGKYSHIAITAQRIKEDKTAFNTYNIFGLPPIPVGSVSKEAIDAAIHPAKSSYLYFVKNDKTGVHTFSKDFTSHIKAIEQNR